MVSNKIDLRFGKPGSQGREQEGRQRGDMLAVHVPGGAYTF